MERRNRVTIEKEIEVELTGCVRQDERDEYLGRIP